MKHRKAELKIRKSLRPVTFAYPGRPRSSVPPTRDLLDASKSLEPKVGFSYIYNLVELEK